VTVQYGVCFFLAVSVLSLFVASFFARHAAGSNGGMRAMQQIAAAFKAGTGAFLKHRTTTVAVLLGLLLPAFANAQEQGGGGEANLVLPDLSSVSFFGITGHHLLMIGLLFCAAGLLFGLVIYQQLKNLPFAPGQPHAVSIVGVLSLGRKKAVQHGLCQRSREKWSAARKGFHG